MKLILKAHPSELKALFDSIVKTDEKGARVEVELARLKTPPIPLVLKTESKEEPKI